MLQFLYLIWLNDSELPDMKKLGNLEFTMMLNEVEDDNVAEYGIFGNNNPHFINDS